MSEEDDVITGPAWLEEALNDPLQRSLFDPQPYQKHSATSREAAEHIAGSANTLRKKVYDYLRSEPEGATDMEMQVVLGMDGSTQRPRRVKLVELGLVRDSGRTKKSSSGRTVTVWEVVK